MHRNAFKKRYHAKDKLMGEIDANIEIDENSTWNDAYTDVTAGVGTGFSMYGLIPLMTVVGVVIALLVGAFVIKRE